MWRRVILMRASRAGLPTCLAMSSTKLRTTAREWVIAGATWVTPALAYRARLAVRTESSFSFASAIFSVHGRPATPMTRSPWRRGASSASSLAAACETVRPERSIPADPTPGLIVGSCAATGPASSAQASTTSAARTGRRGERMKTRVPSDPQPGRDRPPGAAGLRGQTPSVRRTQRVRPLESGGLKGSDPRAAVSPRLWGLDLQVAQEREGRVEPGVARAGERPPGQRAAGGGLRLARHVLGCGVRRLRGAQACDRGPERRGPARQRGGGDRDGADASVTHRVHPGDAAGAPDAEPVARRAGRRAQARSGRA